MSKKKENKKLGMVLNGFLNSKIAEGMKEEELVELLDTLSERDDSHITEMGLTSLSRLARNCEKNMRKFKIVIEDMVSVLITAHRNGLLDKLIISEDDKDSWKGKLILTDSSGDVKISKEQEEAMSKIKEETRDKLFSERGMKSFLSFVESELGEVYCKIWEDVDFIGHSTEAMLGFLKATPEEVKDIMDKKYNKKKSDRDIPEPNEYNKEVLN